MSLCFSHYRSCETHPVASDCVFLTRSLIYRIYRKCRRFRVCENEGPMYGFILHGMGMHDALWRDLLPPSVRLNCVPSNLYYLVSVNILLPTVNTVYFFCQPPLFGVWCAAISPRTVSNQRRRVVGAYVRVLMKIFISPPNFAIHIVKDTINVPVILERNWQGLLYYLDLSLR